MYKSSAERKREYQRNLRNIKRVYTCVENGVRYDYGAVTAISLSVWAKRKRDHGVKPILFKDFYDQLSMQEQQEIMVAKYNGEKV
jgi:hypothetical protein